MVEVKVLRQCRRSIQIYFEHFEECCICSKLSYTMSRYIEVIFYLYVREKEFRERFNDGLGFCMPHWKLLIEGAKQHLSSSQQDEFFRTCFPCKLTTLRDLKRKFPGLHKSLITETTTSLGALQKMH